MSKQTKSQRIRNLLAQGKSVKEICKAVKCAPGLVYQVKSYDKTKAHKLTAKKLEKRAAKVPVGVWQELPQKATVKDLQKTTGKQWGNEELYNITRGRRVVTQPNGISYTQPRDYYQPKPSLFQRVKNFFLGV